MSKFAHSDDRGMLEIETRRLIEAGEDEMIVDEMARLQKAASEAEARGYERGVRACVEKLSAQADQFRYGRQWDSPELARSRCMVWDQLDVAERTLRALLPPPGEPVEVSAAPDPASWIPVEASLPKTCQTVMVWDGIGVTAAQYHAPLTREEFFEEIADADATEEDFKEFAKGEYVGWWECASPADESETFLETIYLWKPLDPPPDGPSPLPQDVIDLVIAGREALGHFDRAASAAEFTSYLARQFAWQSETFGDGPRPGVVEHVRKECVEIEADLLDRSEWLDMVFLALDGYRRAGGRPGQVLPDLEAKLTRNMARSWPDFRAMPDGAALEHHREGEG